MRAQATSLEHATDELAAARRDLDDQKLLAQGLEARVRRLREQQQTQQRLGLGDEGFLRTAATAAAAGEDRAAAAAAAAAESARRQQQEQQQQQEQRRHKKLHDLAERRSRYDAESSRLMALLKRFVDGRLGPMLAAEDLGGPVVGDLVDVDAADSLDFTSRGKIAVRTRRTSTAAAAAAAAGGNGASKLDEKRQRRIDEIWGPSRRRRRRRQGDDGDESGAEADRGGDDDDDDDDDNETGGRGEGDAGETNDRPASAAAAEMRSLIEDLLNRLADSAGVTSAAYVKLDRESAAARFLVRSKAARFHPNDATRLRLVDFGRDLDDW